MNTLAKQLMRNTRRRVVELLKLQGTMTTEELGRKLRITSMGARGHLINLEREGLVERQPEQRGRGRPSYVYALTERGDEFFPRTYDQLADSLLDALRSLEGEAGLDRLFERRTAELEAQYRVHLDGKPLRDRVRKLAQIRTAEGYMANWERLAEDEFVLREHNCAICQVARRYRQVCSYELELFRRALPDVEVSRQQHIIPGDQVCTYLIRSKG